VWVNTPQGKSFRRGVLAVLQANSVTDVLTLTKRYGKYGEVYYRGQSSKHKSVDAGIARNQGLLANEPRLYEEAIRRKEKDFASLGPIERLARLQHHGCPTRLIDLTVDPLVGLFFSVCDVEEQCSGRLYVYVQGGKALDDRGVRLLSLLAWLEDRSAASIQAAYQKEYGEPISGVEIGTLTDQTVFVRYSKELEKLESRLYSQKGTFAVCGNRVRNGVIERDLCSLDTVEPTAIIEIPFEHKLVTKRELDQSHGINEAEAFSRDLDKISLYVIDRFRSLDDSVGDRYRVIEVKNTQFLGVQRVAARIMLKEPVRFEQIKEIAATIMDEYKKWNGVVWVYIARNNEDYIMGNWVLEGQWIALGLEERGPFPIGPPDADGYRWRIAKEYLRLAEFYDKHVFEDDCELFVCHQKIYETVRTAYSTLHQAFNRGNLSEFLHAVEKHKDSLTRAFLRLGRFGHSRNKEFDDFLGNYSRAALSLDTLSVWANKTGISDRRRQAAIRADLEETGKYIEIIDRQSRLWARRLQVSDADFLRVDPYDRPKREYNYEPTMPVSPDALVVEFEVEVEKDSDNASRILGRTNLFDQVTLMVRVTDAQGHWVADRKSEVISGRFEIAWIPGGPLRPEGQPYRVEVSSPLPSLQPKEFLEKAGIEYENLTGPCLERTGLAPTIRFKTDLAI